MNVVLLAIGVAVLAVTVVDLLWTTLWSDGGAGPLSARLAAYAWAGLRTAGRGHGRLLSTAGPIILVLTLSTWIGLLWGGWTLVFASSEASLVDTLDDGPVGWIQYAYFVAYTVFTLGNGGFAPTDGVWQLVTSLATASGMLFVTLGVSYVLSVLGAVVDKRSFASTVTSVGTESEAFVRNGWNGEDFRDLDHVLHALTTRVGRLAKQHRAYPILHYYHSEDATDSSALAVGVFDDALTILRYGVPEDHRPNGALLHAARGGVHDYVATLSTGFVDEADDPPPAPDLRALRDAGVPTVPDSEFRDALDELSDRRRTLLGVATDDARQWPGDDE